jgi:hypothetical protein
MAVAAAEVAGLAILVSIFRNLGSIDINNLKNLKDKLMNTSLALLLLLAPFRVFI